MPLATDGNPPFFDEGGTPVFCDGGTIIRVSGLEHEIRVYGFCHELGFTVF